MHPGGGELYGNSIPTDSDQIQIFICQQCMDKNKMVHN